MNISSPQESESIPYVSCLFPQFNLELYLILVVSEGQWKKLMYGWLITACAGGNVVLLYASKYKDVPIVVNMSARFNLARGMEGRLGKDFIRGIKQDGFIDVRNKRGEPLDVIIDTFLSGYMSRSMSNCFAVAF